MILDLQVGQHAALLRIAGAQRRYLSDALQRIAGLELRRIGAVQEAIATFLANYQCVAPIGSGILPESRQSVRCCSFTELHARQDASDCRDVLQAHDTSTYLLSTCDISKYLRDAVRMSFKYSRPGSHMMVFACKPLHAKAS